MYYRKCPKCGETNMHEVFYDSEIDKLVVSCPMCKFTKREDTHERVRREATNGRSIS